tara:strand:- start:7 stop:465 length:459 start_codon:yes stop_codon:yes gene_type:complete
MEPVKELSLKIIHKLNPEHVKKIKSYIGFIELSCDIVEEAYQRIKSKQFKINSEYKKNLALDLSLHLLRKLVDDGLIDQELKNKIENFISETDDQILKNIIDDIIGIWNDIKVTTLKFFPCIKPNKRTIRKLEGINVQDTGIINDDFKMTNI